MKNISILIIALLLTIVPVILTMIPVITASDTGGSINISVETEEFEPLIWLCDHRVVIDDEIEYGRVQGDAVFAQKIELCANNNTGVCTFSGINQSSCESAGGTYINNICYTTEAECTNVSGTFTANATRFWCNTQCNLLFGPNNSLFNNCVSNCMAAASDTATEQGLGEYCPIMKGPELIERHNNYAFEGEKIEWKVLVMDKNKIEEVEEVVATVDENTEVECVRLNGFASPGDELLDECNARIDEEELTEFDDQTMAYYECTLTVETPESMDDEVWVTIEAESVDGSATIDEDEFWFFNPAIALSIDGTVDFGVVRPGTIAYSDTILVTNDADPNSGVLLDMFMSGTDFYDPDNSGARCIITNRLKLGNNYVSSTNNGLTGVSTNECEIGFGDTDDHFCYYATNGAHSTQVDPRNDAEGYAPIVYGTTFDTDFYNDAEIIQANRPTGSAYWLGNLLTPGADMAITFKLGLPEPCTGNFDDGNIYFWGEVI